MMLYLTVIGLSMMLYLTVIGLSMMLYLTVIGLSMMFVPQESRLRIAHKTCSDWPLPHVNPRMLEIITVPHTSSG